MQMAEYRRQRKLGMISLEYHDVIRATSCYEFMVRAHSTRINQPDALMLWLKICTRHSVPFKGFIIRWTTKSRARGGRHYGCGYLKINTTYLTVGLMLHELSHVIQYMNFKERTKPHGREFVQIFDLLLLEYYSGQLN